VIGNDLRHDPRLLSIEGDIRIQYFPDIIFSDNFIEVQSEIPRESHWIRKRFQYHKFHLFTPFFKQWKYIFYIDCGVHIFQDISPILNERRPATLFAMSDAYPIYEWKLERQFSRYSPYFDRLSKTYDLAIDYFQSTILLYDTESIADDTFEKLVALAEEFPISVTNDQGIVALYFIHIVPLYKQIRIKNNDTFFYDYIQRVPEPYIITKLLL
jgi:hypothetical protein